MAPTDDAAAPPRRRARLLSLLLTLVLVGAGAWFLLRRRAPALPGYVDEARPGPSTTARPVPGTPDDGLGAPAVAPGPPAAEPATAAVAPPPDPQPAPTPPGPADAPDAATASEELQRVSGIGRRSADALVAAGIDSLDRLAASDDATLVAALEAVGLRRSPTLSAWASQARRLRQG